LIKSGLTTCIIDLGNVRWVNGPGLAVLLQIQALNEPVKSTIQLINIPAQLHACHPMICR
jgi:ABC-type transporter Mla MlaB component